MTERLSTQSLELISNDIHGLQLYRGLSVDLVEQLVAKSKEREISRWTPKDSSVRFHDEDSTWDWLAQGREVYPLMQGFELAGLAWYGEKPFPADVPDRVDESSLPNHTFAIRIYDGYRGYHLTKPMMDLSLHDYISGLKDSGQISSFRGLWLTTSPANTRAARLYESYGYRQSASNDKEAIMVLPLPAVTNRLRALSSAG